MRVATRGEILNANKHSWILLSFWKTDVGGSIPSQVMELISSPKQINFKDEIELQIGFKAFLLKVSPDWQKEYIDIFAFDLTERKQAEIKLMLNAQVFESAFEAIMITDADQRILDVNQAFCNITGYSREEILGEEASILQSGRHGPEFYQMLWAAVNEKGTWQGEIWDRKKNGDVYPKWLSISSVTDGEGKISRYIGLFSDITVMKETEEKLYHMANYDTLTGLVNRRYFQDQLERSLQQARRMHDSVAVMFIDLDTFKLINDNLGHQTGDQALRIVAERLLQCVRDTDTVARMGGDEFTIILPLIQNSQSVVQVAEKILRQVVKPIKLKHIDHFISTSIGIAVFPDDAEDADLLIQNADTALYRAKDMGKNIYQFFSPEMNNYVKERLSLQTRIRHALDSNQLTVYYQPQVDMRENRLVGVEALVRWAMADGAFFDPDNFIPIAEETSLINEIGDFVLRTVCRQGKIWLDENLLTVPISVNISSVQLHRQDIIRNIKTAIVDSGFPPGLLEFELTETILIENVSDIQDKLGQLKSLGCSLAIDDFGTEYSSLLYLKMFPIDKLKIDKSFIRDLPKDSSSADIVRAIIAMGRNLKINVIAEGVETPDQASFLRDNGCTLAQGFLYNNPLTVVELNELLKVNKEESRKRRTKLRTGQ